MAERAVLLGGRLAAGPRPDGGWTVDCGRDPSPGTPKLVTIRVLVTDDHEPMRTALTMTLWCAVIGMGDLAGSLAWERSR
jgi:hypothetical protein